MIEKKQQLGKHVLLLTVEWVYYSTVYTIPASLTDETWR